jgi:hypothetical protein
MRWMLAVRDEVVRRAALALLGATAALTAGPSTGWAASNEDLAVHIKVFAGVGSQVLERQGSGFLVNADGIIVTTRQVVLPALDRAAGRQIRVSLKSKTGSEVPAEPRCADGEADDVCIIEIPGAAVAASGIKEFASLSCGALEPNEQVRAIGYDASPANTVLSVPGEVTGRDRHYLTDIKFSAGMNGGAVRDRVGYVVGIVKDGEPHQTRVMPMAQALPQLQRAQVACPLERAPPTRVLIYVEAGSDELKPAKGVLELHLKDVIETWSQGIVADIVEETNEVWKAATEAALDKSERDITNAYRNLTSRLSSHVDEPLYIYHVRVSEWKSIAPAAGGGIMLHIRHALVEAYVRSDTVVARPRLLKRELQEVVKPPFDSPAARVQLKIAASRLFHHWLGITQRPFVRPNRVFAGCAYQGFINDETPRDWAGVSGQLRNVLDELLPKKAGFEGFVAGGFSEGECESAYSEMMLLDKPLDYFDTLVSDFRIQPQIEFNRDDMSYVIKGVLERAADRGKAGNRHTLKHDPHFAKKEIGSLALGLATTIAEKWPYKRRPQ